MILGLIVNEEIKGSVVGMVRRSDYGKSKVRK